VLARLAVATVAAAAAVVVCLNGAPLEDATVDARYALRQTGPADGIVVVAIDDASIARLGAWPFRRREHARAIARLDASGVRAIVYDVQFTEPSPHASDDLALYTALGEAGGAVLATSTSDEQGRTRVLGGDDVLAEVNSRAGAANFDGDVIRRYPARVGRLNSLALVTAERLGRAPAPFADAWIDFRSSVRTVSFADLVAGRIAAICDVFDALLTERPYKRAWTREETLGYIEAERGRHFDPELATLFLAIADQPAGVRAPSHVGSA
jgi:adenylate cyclase